MRWRRRANPARPDVCLLIIFIFLIPSVRPLWKGRVSAALTAWMSRSSPWVTAPRSVRKSAFIRNGPWCYAPPQPVSTSAYSTTRQTRLIRVYGGVGVGEPAREERVALQGWARLVKAFGHASGPHSVRGRAAVARARGAVLRRGRRRRGRPGRRADPHERATSRSAWAAWTSPSASRCSATCPIGQAPDGHTGRRRNAQNGYACASSARGGSGA